jgi:transcriptional regulator with XRE-family HTH domain
MHIGKKIKVARVKMEMTQEELAEKIGKTRPLISQIENTGKIKNNTLRAICKVLDIDLDDPDFHAFFEEHELYSHNSKGVKNIEAMERELDTLRALVEAQREIIAHLKRKKNSAGKRRGKNRQ